MKYKLVKINNLNRRATKLFAWGFLIAVDELFI